MKKEHYTRKRYEVGQTLGEFIKAEMKARDMSAREFAKLIEVAPSTITTYLSDTNSEPTLSFLRKLAQKTNTPLGSIIAIAFPEVAGEISDLPPDVILLAIGFAKLPEPIRNVIKRIVSGEE